MILCPTPLLLLGAHTLWGLPRAPSPQIFSKPGCAVNRSKSLRHRAQPKVPKLRVARGSVAPPPRARVMSKSPSINLWQEVVNRRFLNLNVCPNEMNLTIICVQAKEFPKLNIMTSRGMPPTIVSVPEMSTLPILRVDFSQNLRHSSPAP